MVAIEASVGSADAAGAFFLTGSRRVPGMPLGKRWASLSSAAGKPQKVSAAEAGG